MEKEDETRPPVPARLRELPTRLLGQAATLAQRLVAEGLNGADARKWHYAALVALDEYGPASQAALSTRTGIHRSDLVAVLNELAERGDVERAPDPADRRRNVITLTPHGRKQLHRLEELLRAAQEELLAPLSPREQQQLTALLTKLVTHHAGAAGRMEPSGNRPKEG
ncbi:MarR family transcriptional regulator [Streptomyces sp. NPDC089799]|uniref:MarR family winged helix-turn-helix transcriptional regulator n=1 Tax=Streptomyces sp. NPDC089799 TaxID=3155066 RepID=UPI0034488C5F